MTEYSRKLFLTCLLSFVGSSLNVLILTYSSMIFLNHYGVGRIPYLYILSGIASILLSESLKKSIAKNFYGVTIRTHAVILLGMIGCTALSNVDLKWISFFISMYLLVAYGFSSIILNTVRTCPFNLREFKVASKWLMTWSAMGGLVWGVIVPIILATLSPVSVFITIILLFSVIIIVMRVMKNIIVTTQSRVVPAKSELRQMLKHSLVFSVFLLFSFSVITATFADFSVKSVMVKYAQSTIGNILAPYYSLVNIVAIFAQLFAADKIIKYYGLFGLLNVYLGALLLGSLGLFIYPSLPTALLFGLLVSATQYSLFATARQMIANVLPDAIRTMVGYVQQGSITNYATGFAALILIPIGWGGLRAVGFCMLLAGIAFFYYLRILKQKYQQSLTESINLHRFNADYLDVTHPQHHLIAEQAGIALQSPHADVQLFGIELLKQLRLKKVPDVLYESLRSNSTSVVHQALKTIQSIHDESALEFLHAELSNQHPPKIIWDLVKTILAIDGNILLSFARKNQKETDPYLQCAVICIYLKFGNVDELVFALNQFKKMIASPDPKSRIIACNILRMANIGDLSSYLILLLQDEDLQVIRKALKLAPLFPTPAVIEAILEKTSDQRVILTLGKVVTQMGAQVLPFLIQKIEQQGKITHEVNLLAKIPGDIVDQTLLNLIEHPDARIQELVANHLAYRAIRYPHSPEIKKLIGVTIHQETSRIQLLIRALVIETHEGIQAEIRSRIWFRQKKYLNLLIAYTENEFLLELLPTLLSKTPHQHTYFKSVELLEDGVEDKMIASTIEFAIEGKQQSGTLDKHLLQDPWLDQLTQFKLNQLPRLTMDLIHKMLVLRRVALFENLSAESIQHIAEILQDVNVVQGQVIFNQGDFANGLYIVAKGDVDIVQGSTVLKTCHESEFFGELALLDNQARTATATAHSDSLLYLLSTEDFNRLTEDVPEILRVIVKTIMGYLRPLLAQ